MMINANQFQRIDGQLKAVENHAPDATQNARVELHRMAADIVGKNGAIKQGYIKLVKADGGAMRLGTRWSTSADGSTRDALSYVRSLVEKGYGGNPKVQAAIDNYIKAKGDRLGTHSFVKLVRELENANQAERPDDDRVTLARVKADATLQTEGFADAAPAPAVEAPAVGAQLLGDVSASQMNVMDEMDQLDEAEAQRQAEPLAGLVGGSMDLQMNALLLNQVPVRQPEPYLQVPPPVVAAEVRAPAPPPARQAPAPAAPKPPPQTRAELHQAALDAVRRGKRADAIEHLQKIDGPLSPAQLAKFVVQDDLQGRAISTQLVLMAEAAYSGQPRGALDKVAEFVFEGTTLPHAAALDDAQFDASNALSGLFDVAMLWQARRPAESKALAHQLADKLMERLPHNESAAALAQRLRTAVSMEPISISKVESKIKLKDFALNHLKDPDKSEDAKLRIQAWLQNVQARHPGDEALSEKMGELIRLAKLQSMKKEAVDESDDESDDDDGAGRRQMESIKRQLQGVIDAATAADAIGDLDEKLNVQAEALGHLSVIAKPIDHQSVPSEPLKKVVATAAKRDLAVQGSSFQKAEVTQAQNSNIYMSYDAIDGKSVENGGVNLQRCILGGTADSLYLPGSNFAGSDLTFEIDDYTNAEMRKVNFSNVNLDDARIHINWDNVDGHIHRKRLKPNSQGAVETLLVRLMNHHDHHTGGSVLTAIASIDDKYADLKAGLMRDAMELLARERCIDALAPALVDVLSRSPVFLADARIRELSAPFLPGMIENLARSGRPEFLPALAQPLLELTAAAEPQDAQQALRSQISLVNTILRRVEDNPGAYDQVTQDAAAQLRARVHDLPEIKPLLPTLDDLYLEHQRADGQKVPMPYYFEFGRDGAVAALDAAHYSAVALEDPAAKLVEDTMFFVPPSQRYGQVNESYYPVGDSPLVLLAPGNIKDRGVDLLKQFPLLEKAYQAGQPTPANALLSQIFAGPDAAGTRQMFTDAFKGVARRLSEQEIVDLQTRFAGLTSKPFTNVEEAGGHFPNWPKLQLSDTLLQSLREQAALAGVDTDSPHEFGHYLLTQSAVLTRLSSEKVFGDGDNSIPPLRMLGYGLFKEALRVAPQLLDPEQSLNMEDRFLKRNNAMDCAEILSRMQLKASKQINPVAFESLTPSVFKGAAA